MKFGKKQLSLLSLAIVVVAVVGIIYFNSINSEKPVTRYKFQGVELSFRDDLRLAKNISVYPNEESVLNTIWDPDIQRITIAFMNTTDNQFTAVNAFEITYKLNIGYGQFNWLVGFEGKEVDSFESLNGSKENPIIVLLPPSLSNETSVELNDNIAYIKGKTQKEFDLATMKFIMSALNITI